MKAYYEADGITIYHGDCREILPAIGRASAVIADPPYGETSLDWDRRLGGWLEVAALVTDSVWVFGSLQLFIEMAQSGELGSWKRSQEIVWEKHNGSGFQADRFKRVHELAAHFYRGSWEEIFKAPVYTADATARTVRRKKRPAHMGYIEASAYSSQDGGPRLMRSVVYARSCHGEAEHPTQKPVSILSPLIQYSSPVGGLIVDPFAGSGSTLVAARLNGRRGVGIEIQEKYCEIAARRLDQGVLQL